MRSLAAVRLLCPCSLLTDLLLELGPNRSDSLIVDGGFGACPPPPAVPRCDCFLGWPPLLTFLLRMPPPACLRAELQAGTLTNLDADFAVVGGECVGVGGGSAPVALPLPRCMVTSPSRTCPSLALQALGSFWGLWGGWSFPRPAAAAPPRSGSLACLSSEAAGGRHHRGMGPRALL